MDQTIKIQPNSIIQNSVLNSSISKMFSYIENINPVLHTGTYATSAASGAVQFTNTLNTITTSAALKAISPLTLYSTINNAPIALNTYFGNNISNTVTHLDTTMQYIILLNKTIMMFGKINTTLDNTTINLTQLFSNTPYTLDRLYFINIGGGEVLNDSNVALPNITSMSHTTVDVYQLSYPITDWFALGRIV